MLIFDKTSWTYASDCKISRGTTSSMVSEISTLQGVRALAPEDALADRRWEV